MFNIYEFPQVIQLGKYTLTVDFTEEEKAKQREARFAEDKEHLERARNGHPGASLWLVGRSQVIDTPTGQPLFELLGTSKEEVEGLAHEWCLKNASERLATLRNEVAEGKSWEAQGSSYFLQLHFSDNDHHGMSKKPWEIVDPSEIGLSAQDVKKLPTPRRPHEGKG